MRLSLSKPNRLKYPLLAFVFCCADVAKGLCVAEVVLHAEALQLALYRMHVELRSAQQIAASLPSHVL